MVECKKSIETSPSFVLYSDPHTAKFKDCLCYQKVLKRTFPTPRLEESQKIPIGTLMSEGSKQHYINTPML
ncbi:hypothetical protein M0804_013843 [Polistes exclamans]|nr:hypothetical protein M0804_013843 [Polistes exclamans]